MGFRSASIIPCGFDSLSSKYLSPISVYPQDYDIGLKKTGKWQRRPKDLLAYRIQRFKGYKPKCIISEHVSNSNIKSEYLTQNMYTWASKAILTSWVRCIRNLAPYSSTSERMSPGLLWKIWNAGGKRKQKEFRSALDERYIILMHERQYYYI